MGPPQSGTRRGRSFQCECPGRTYPGQRGDLPVHTAQTRLFDALPHTAQFSLDELAPGVAGRARYGSTAWCLLPRLLLAADDAVIRRWRNEFILDGALE